ncbi:MAG: monofunctional biosynthetic peptidoglycan transglycosylase [Candidatus Obscuribacterales bacterium]|nr:monofunctional biosynthetic peptidoglycan transglycosylase [Steroidobacteraceae bacterium]
MASFAKRLARGFLWLLLGWFVLTIGLVLTLRFVDPFTSAFMLRDRARAWWQNEPRYVFRHEWVNGDQIAAHLKLAVIASEDQKFLEHRGFDFDSIGDALAARERGRRVRGASTITQQVAKNIFLWPGQSWVRKGIEAYFTVLIESLWSKRRIMEIYLNIAEFGRGVYGAKAASHFYFNKTANRITAAEAALLAASLPNPRRLRVASPSAYVRRRQEFILLQMQGVGAAAVRGL